jgi:hypothetical protein
MSVGDKRQLGRIRTPVPKLNYPGFNQELLRTLTIGQLAVLLWHLYRCSKDPDIGYLDANITLSDLVATRLNKTIKLSKGMMERLLWAGNLSEQSGTWWSPDDKSFNEFIQPLLYDDEFFDRTWNLLLNKDQIKRVRNQNRFIKKVNKQKKRKRSK